MFYSVFSALETSKKIMPYILRGSVITFSGTQTYRKHA